VDFFYLTPGRVDFESRTIRGLFYEEGRWVEREVPFPDVIYNVGVSNSQASEEIVDRLYDEIPRTSHSIGDKMTVHNKLQSGKLFAQYLLPSEIITGTAEVMDWVSRHKKVVVKPLSGHKGLSVVYLEQTEHGCLWIEQNDRRLYLREELDARLGELMDGQEFLVQPYISSCTKKGLPFDFRLQPQKDGEGRWVLAAWYPRVGQPGSIITNLSSGGFCTYADLFLEMEFGAQAFDMQRYLERFAVGLAAHMDDLYDGELDELGIDVGIDENGRIWLYEVNWRPGQPVTFFMELDVARNMIHYARYLAEKRRR
jgi:glutathione synthase/RimK-type ligase-like ATP-grasp enzyme